MNEWKSNRRTDGKARIAYYLILIVLFTSLLLLPFIFPAEPAVVAQGSTTPEVTTVESQVLYESESIYVPIYNLPLTEEQQIFVQRVAGYYNIDPAIVYGIMSTESGFDNYAESGDCKGIMQVDQRYVQQWYANSKFLIKQYNITDVSNLFDFKLNVILGCEAYSEWNQIIVDKEMDPLIDTLGAYNNGYNYIAQPDYSYSVDVINFAYKIQMQDRLYEVSL